jgi:hypothetical protein
VLVCISMRSRSPHGRPGRTQQTPSSISPRYNHNTMTVTETTPRPAPNIKSQTEVSKYRSLANLSPPSDMDEDPFPQIAPPSETRDAYVYHGDKSATSFGARWCRGVFLHWYHNFNPDKLKDDVERRRHQMTEMPGSDTDSMSNGEFTPTVLI